MADILIQQCPLIQKMHNEGLNFSLAVVSKKHNEHKGKFCPIVKHLIPESVSNDKLKKYVREKRLVVIAGEQKGPLLFLRNGKDCYTQAPQLICYVDKSSSSDATSLKNELREVVVEEISDDEYEQFCTFCLSTTSEYSKPSEEETIKKSGASKTVVSGQDFVNLRRDQFVLSILYQLAEIVNRHFDIIREAREEDAEQLKVQKRKAAEKAEQRRYDDVHHQETLRRHRKEAERKTLSNSFQINDYREQGKKE
ncbi:MAG: hypothetical protein AAGG81_00715 [Chlamydiota bacterium]